MVFLGCAYGLNLATGAAADLLRATVGAGIFKNCPIKSGQSAAVEAAD